MGKAYGIDLGTTYSCVAYVNEVGMPVVVKNMEGELTTPSVVMFNEDGTVTVGTTAKDESVLYPDRVVAFIKREIGNGVKVTRAGQDYLPEEISSFILKKIVSDANQFLNEDIKDVVITVPAYFGNAEREATKKAGEFAELNVLKVVNEPTAAALAYFSGLGEAEEDKTILVYDLGGGTFDVTVLKFKGNEVTAIATAGDHKLGGKDWDDRIYKFVCSGYANMVGANVEDLADDAEFDQELKNKCEKMKKELSTKMEASTVLSAQGYTRQKITITRNQFDTDTLDLLNRTMMLTNEAIEEAKQKKCTKIDEIVLVGGSTRMPQVLELVKSKFSDKEIRLIDPDESVAKGAAVLAQKEVIEKELKEIIAETTGEEVKGDSIEQLEKLDEKVQETVMKKFADYGYTLADVQNAVKFNEITSKSFGVKCFRGNTDEEVISNLIVKNEQVPCDVTMRFGVKNKNQKTVDLQVFEGASTSEEAEVGSCTLLSSVILDLPSGLDVGAPVDITFKLNEEGVLDVVGKEGSEGRECAITIKTVNSLSKEETQEIKNRVSSAIMKN